MHGYKIIYECSIDQIVKYKKYSRDVRNHIQKLRKIKYYCMKEIKMDN